MITINGIFKNLLQKVIFCINSFLGEYAQLILQVASERWNKQIKKIIKNKKEHLLIGEINKNIFMTSICK